MKKTLKIFLFIVGFIVIVNLIGLAISMFTESSLILKVKPLNEVFVFAHGENICFDNGGYSHISLIDGKPYPTKRLLENLRKEGYEKIWISMCDQGNSDYVIDYGNGTKIEWGEDISRVKGQGTVYPIYWGLGVYRLNFKETKQDGKC